MKCYYEVLEVPREATLNEIRSSYKKLALKWHPDKNLDSTEDVKENFQLIQQAYEVLSDPQERAWYDRHREQLLRGPSSNFEDKSMNIFQYFTTGCFKGYSDDENGFYTIYSKVFDEISNEEIEFFENKNEFLQIPKFGNSQTEYEDVKCFYDYWSCFQTKKSFVWLNVFDIQQTTNKRYIKLMEKENKKVRQEAKKERNEEIRNLVAFVRKRDKRVQKFSQILQAKILENRQKHEEIKKQKKLDRLKQLNDTSEEAEWAKFDKVQSELEDIEQHLKTEFGDNEESDEEDLYCIACNKVFKTLKSFQNHELSKKHKLAVQKIREEMLEDEELNDDDEISSNSESDVEEIVVESDSKTKKSKKADKKKKVLQPNMETEEQNEFLENLVTGKEFIDLEKNKKQGRKSKKNKNTADKPKEEANLTQEELNGDYYEVKDDDSEILIEKSKTKKSKTKKNKNIEESQITTTCLTCNSNFSSKNKLFEHLKATGHGIPLTSKKDRRKN